MARDAPESEQGVKEVSTPPAKAAKGANQALSAMKAAIQLMAASIGYTPMSARIASICPWVRAP